jgi:hypothetical protein
VAHPYVFAPSSEGSIMDPLALGSPLPLWPARTPASRDPESELLGAPGPEAGFAADLMAALDSSPGKGQPTQQESALHLLSHVDAACFISLLQIQDPKPDDYRARAEYKRHYQRLESVLTLPEPTGDR